MTRTVVSTVKTVVINVTTVAFNCCWGTSTSTNKNASTATRVMNAKIIWLIVKSRVSDIMGTSEDVNYLPANHACQQNLCQSLVPRRQLRVLDVALGSGFRPILRDDGVDHLVELKESADAVVEPHI